MFSSEQQSVLVQKNIQPIASLNKVVRPPLQCWGCKKPRMYKDFHLNKNGNLTMHNIEEATTSK